MAPEVSSFADFWKRLAEAIDKVDKLAAVDPDPVKQWTTGGVRPAQDDLDKLTFGQMASRAVDDTDRALAEELYKLANYLVEWPASQPIRQ